MNDVSMRKRPLTKNIVQKQLISLDLQKPLTPSIGKEEKSMDEIVEFEQLHRERSQKYCEIFKTVKGCGRKAVLELHNELGYNVEDILNLMKEGDLLPGHYVKEWDDTYPTWYQPEHEMIWEEFFVGVKEGLCMLIMEGKLF